MEGKLRFRYGWLIIQVVNYLVGGVKEREEKIQRFEKGSRDLQTQVVS